MHSVVCFKWLWSQGGLAHRAERFVAVHQITLFTVPNVGDISWGNQSSYMTKCLMKLYLSGSLLTAWFVEKLSTSKSFQIHPSSAKWPIWEMSWYSRSVTTWSEDVMNSKDEYFILTWAQCGAGHSLEGRALTEGSSIQRGGIGAAACSSLPAPPTPSITLWPFSPRRPTSAHWWRNTPTHTQSEQAWQLIAESN